MVSMMRMNFLECESFAALAGLLVDCMWVGTFKVVEAEGALQGIRLAVLSASYFSKHS